VEAGAGDDRAAVGDVALAVLDDVFVEEGSVVVPVDLSDVGDAVFVDTVFAVQAFGGHVFTPRILIFDSESP